MNFRLIVMIVDIPITASFEVLIAYIKCENVAGEEFVGIFKNAVWTWHITILQKKCDC